MPRDAQAWKSVPFCIQLHIIILGIFKHLYLKHSFHMIWHNLPTYKLDYYYIHLLQPKLNRANYDPYIHHLKNIALVTTHNHFKLYWFICKLSFFRDWDRQVPNNELSEISKEVQKLTWSTVFTWFVTVSQHVIFSCKCYAFTSFSPIRTHWMIILTSFIWK